MHLREIALTDREPLAALIRRIDVFNSSEREVALELIDEALLLPGPDGYRCIIALTEEGGDGVCAGYVCFGKTPMTQHMYDMYWIAVDPTLQGGGVGTKLLDAMIEKVSADGGRGIRVETSSTDAYGGSLQFYLRRGFSIAGRIPNFYRKDDDLIILFRDIP